MTLPAGIVIKVQHSGSADEKLPKLSIGNVLYPPQAYPPSEAGKSGQTKGRGDMGHYCAMNSTVPMILPEVIEKMEKMVEVYVLSIFDDAEKLATGVQQWFPGLTVEYMDIQDLRNMLNWFTENGRYARGAVEVVEWWRGGNGGIGDDMGGGDGRGVVVEVIEADFSPSNAKFSLFPHIGYAFQDALRSSKRHSSRHLACIGP
ncbi:hypothetical protein CONLIGDRAFT_684968 [Coniochaeta ligniaria NRRL 30616]|uniref:Uncharacterized protein n=1 Tax=Coniochaeta ligniaria NRRL 30616 TaxID=1408157 RepID=A0A1J7IBN4_9PEZI|nr:hypothetical protein CONLIGDRAFT_684968 [Coniochaeta ligniaria NRRL 30616]